MKLIHNYLIDKGFIVVIENKNIDNKIKFLYEFTIDGFAKYSILITSYSNWVFRMETEKKSLSNLVVGFSNHTCFLGVISSESPIEILEILEIIFKATGINTILELTNYINNNNETS